MSLFEQLQQRKVKLKICGLASFEDIEACAQLGVDALGFLLNKTEDESRSDKLSLKDAAALIQAVPKQVSSVLLMKDLDLLDISRKIDFVRPNVVQLQNLDLNGNQLKTLNASFPNVEFIKTIRIHEQISLPMLLQEADVAMKYASAILLDAAKGGSGLTHDWVASRFVRDHCAQNAFPIVLAGGLNFENISAAISQVKPFMLDIMSGVSKSRGVKDIYKIGQIVQYIDTL